MKPFPIPVVGAGSHVEEEALEYIDMPKDMSTFAVPRVDEDADPAVRAEAFHVLEQLLDAMKAWTFGAPSAPRIDLLPLRPPVRAAINELLGEGEVSLIVEGTPRLRIQETVFAGVWRVLGEADDGVIQDVVCACALPEEAIARARAGSRRDLVAPALPDGVMNAPAVLTELAERATNYREGDEAHIVNLTLLPMSPADHGYLGSALGGGTVTVLSRGYGNCRVTSTALENTWWVQYFNSVDTVILSTIEVTDVPDVVPAAADDFADSIERLGEWVETLRAWEAS
ncbi:MAG: hypothetical protein KDH20_21885 [Rhodocyclaceae bacterium]|nr:hypothetical protein [Rhodocyclaceae bacterium]